MTMVLVAIAMVAIIAMAALSIDIVTCILQERRRNALPMRGRWRLPEPSRSRASPEIPATKPVTGS